MKKRNDSNLFFVCSLIEQIGRDCHRRRSEVVKALGRKKIARVYAYADVFHCEPIGKVAQELIEEVNLKPGDYDNVAACRYKVPDVWTIGKVYARLIEDCNQDVSVIDTLCEVYASWMDAAIGNFNAATYYQQREYLAESYREGCLLDL